MATAITHHAGSLATNYSNIAAYRTALGDLDGAREAAREGLRWARQGQDALGITTSTQHLAMVGVLLRQAHTAARLIGYVNAQYKELGQEREATERWGYEKLMSTLREHLSEAEIEKLAGEGAAWSEDRAVEERSRFRLGAKSKRGRTMLPQSKIVHCAHQ